MQFLSRLKHTLLGRPIHTKKAHHEKLPKWMALPVFASDALSSTAYATEEIMHVFMATSIAFLGFTTNIAIVIASLIFIVSISYWQTIQAYPHGGGSYIVARDNLGKDAGLVAAAALMLDYILTVAVSVSAGVLALISLLPVLQPYNVWICLGFLIVLTTMNLRGAKESGALFAIPTYAFVVLMGVMIIVGLLKGGVPEPAEILAANEKLKSDPLTQGTMIAMLFKAFSSGCAAMTGIEAISDGAGAFREPTAKNASATLFTMAGLLSFLFIGTSVVANKFHVVPFHSITVDGYKTVVAQVCQAVFDPSTPAGNAYFWAIQISTCLILILAANTAYADFPRLCSFVARDGFLPRQLANLGDRLVFQNGILMLAGCAAVLIIVFAGNTHKLIPLYAVGVFISFTMSQSGMVARAFKLKQINWKVYVSMFGAGLSAVIAIVLEVSKFKDGAWMVPIALGLFILNYKVIRKHYDYLAKELEPEPHETAKPVKTTVLLLVPRIHRGILQAIAYARALSDDVRAIHVTIDPAGVQRVKEEWIKHGEDMPLVILESPYRSLVAPVIDYIDQSLAEDPDLFITVIVPEAVPKFWLHKVLHNNVAIPLKIALKSRKNVVITNVRYFLS